jgi:hypothetical protein
VGWSTGGCLVWLVALVQLGRLLLRLQTVRRVLRYPALPCAIAPLCAYPVEWGPVLLWLGVPRELLLLLLLLLLGVLLGVLRVVLGRHLGRVVALVLEERVVVVLVLLVGGGQVGARALVPLLVGMQALLLVQLLGEADVALADRLAAAHAVLARLLRGVLVLAVPREVGGDAAAERLLGGLARGGRRLRRRLVCAGRAGLRRVVLRLVEVGAEAVGARAARGIGLLLLLVRRGVVALDERRRTLALCNSVLAVCLEALVVYCQRWFVSRTRAHGRPNLISPDGFGDDWPDELSTDWCERLVLFLEKSEGMAEWAATRSSSGDAASWRWRGGAETRWPQLDDGRANNNRQQGWALHSVAKGAQGRGRQQQHCARRTRLLQVTARRLLVPVPADQPSRTCRGAE